MRNSHGELKEYQDSDFSTLSIYHLYGTMYNSIIYIILIKCGCLYWVKKMLQLDNASVYHCSSTNVEGSLYGTKKLPCYNKVKLDC